MITHYDECEEHLETRNADGTPVWQLVLLLLLGSLGLFVTGAVICLIRGIAPTMYNMLNDTTVTAPFAVSAVNLLQASHFVVALGLYYRSRLKCYKLAKTQLYLAGATHTTLLLVLFLLPFLGWSQDWASPLAMLVWAAWELCVLLVLRAIYRHRLVREKRFQKLSVASFVLYAVSTLVYIVLRIVHLPRSSALDTGLLIVECVCAFAVLCFMVLLLIHVKRVCFSMYVRVVQRDANQNDQHE